MYIIARSADAEEEDVPAGQEDADEGEEPEEEDDAAIDDKVAIGEVAMTPDQVAAINRMHMEKLIVLCFVIM